MMDGAASLMTMTWSVKHMGIWSDERGTNLLDTGAHFYDTYETADGKYVSIGSMEPQFYAELLRLTGLESEDLPRQMDKSAWPALKVRLAEVFRTKTHDEWCELMEHTDVCFAPCWPWTRHRCTPTSPSTARSPRWLGWCSRHHTTH